MRIQDRRGIALATLLATRTVGRVSRRAAAPLAGALWFTPWRVETPRARAGGDAWLERATRLELPDGLAGAATGDGPTVLLVHGWGTRGATMRVAADALAAAGYRAVVMDLPAHGDSPGRRTNLYEAAAAVRTVAETVHARAVVAHSIGGPTTLLALDAALEVDAVALIAPAVRLDEAVARFVERFRLPRRAAEGLWDRIEARFGPEVWAAVAAERIVTGLDVPGLVVGDRDDPEVAIASIERLARAWPGARLVTTSGLGHDRVLRDDGVVAEVAGFIVEHVPSRPLVTT
ncbi:MAG: alpha/beta hydrolase [Actinobacteria bacterium]|nr:alpha/beta hydrolase [Actinomycetota bacterium]